MIPGGLEVILRDRVWMDGRTAHRGESPCWGGETNRDEKRPVIFGSLHVYLVFLI